MSNQSDILNAPVRIIRNLPKSWDFVYLMDCCHPRQWATISKDKMTNEGYPVYGANGLIGYYSSYNHDKETIAVTCRGATCGTVNRIPSQSYITGNAMSLDDIDESMLISPYLYYALNYRNLSDIITGTAQPQIIRNSFKRIRIPRPPVREQEAIARILDAVDKIIEQTQVAVDRSRDVKKSLVQQLFEKGLRGETLQKTAIGPLPKSWRAVPVNSVVTQFQYGLSAEMASKGKYPILRMGNIQAGEILLNDLKYIDLPQKIADTYMLKRGDVLFNRTNSQEHVGKVGIYRSDEQAVFASYLIRLFPDDSQIDRYYLGQLLGSYPAQCRIKRYATPGVQQVNVNAKNIGLVLIPVPTGKNGLQEQRDIAAILEQADERIRAYKPVLDTLADLKRALMQDLLTGKVRVNHAIDKILSLEAS